MHQTTSEKEIASAKGESKPASGLVYTPGLQDGIAGAKGAFSTTCQMERLDHSSASA